MDNTQQQPARYASVSDWLKRHAKPFFTSRGSIDWFIKTHRAELVKGGALIVREGRHGSIVEIDKFSQAVIDIFSRRSVEKVKQAALPSPRARPRKASR
jgi:hypothetical protein